MSNEVTNSTNDKQSQTLDWLKFALALTLALTLSYVTCGFVMLGYDWGYDLIDAFFGQPSGANQGVMAIASLRFLIFPTTFGLSLSLLRSCLGGYRRWYLALAFVCLVSIPALMDTSTFGTLWRHYVDLIGTAVAVIFAIAAFFAGNRILNKFGSAVNPLIALSSSFVYLIPATLYIIMDWFGASIYDWNYKAEVAVYALLIISTACMAVYQSGKADLRASLIVSMVATLPVLAANVLNIFSNILFSLMDLVHTGPDLGWRALLSSVLISLVYALALLAGSRLGMIFSEKFPANT
jgi:hypothetical protein